MGISQPSRELRRTELAIADRDIWTHSASQPLEPVPAFTGHMDPERDWTRCASCDGTEDDIRPGLMADDDVVSSAAQQRGERAASAHQRVGPTQTNPAEQMRNMTEQGQFLTAPSLEAHGELGLHLGGSRRLAGQRGEERFDTAIHIAAGDVQHAHQCTSDS
jgi:hypothetical protein